MPLHPLIGHQDARARLAQAIQRATLPASLLIHGPAGAGKERLALWLAQRLLCAAPAAEGDPCGACQSCRYVEAGGHPDLHWYFPRPRGRDADPDVDDVIADFAGAIADRVEAAARWEDPEPTDSIYVATVRAIVQRAALTPALGRAKVIVVADAERMVAQEGSDQAANAFLKLLEEPRPNTTIILTSSAPSALLPTIRSRTAAFRVPIPDAATRAQLRTASLAAPPPSRDATEAAEALLNAALGSAEQRHRAAISQGAGGARGAFSVTLDALRNALHARARAATERDDAATAHGAARALIAVEDARRLTRQNVNPQLITAQLLRDLAGTLS